jgi:hypothetical protein
MITSDYELLYEECKRRNYDIDKLLEFAGVAPFLDNKTVSYDKHGHARKKLTYCGKTPQQWNRKNK